MPTLHLYMRYTGVGYLDLYIAADDPIATIRLLLFSE